MKKVNNKEKYTYLFNNYSHNIPVIYSSLEGQYDGDLYVDYEDDPQIAILFTPFAFHFVAGNPGLINAAEELDEIIFKRYLFESKQKEAIAFAPDLMWNSILDEVFEKHRGLKGIRKIYRLDKERFNKFQMTRKPPEGVKIMISAEKEGGAAKEYPICRIMKEDKCISFCTGFMLGQGHAELDVFTADEYRGKGYAKEAAASLINELLMKGIEPDWNTWPYRIESQRLALSLGYELINEIAAHIWVEAECGKISQS